MKAITISQPWASKIASGEKWVENRTWETKYRGPLAIHAGLGTQYLSKADLKKYPTGVIIAFAQLTACVGIDEVTALNNTTLRDIIPRTQRSYEELVMHRYSEGPWCWVLEGVLMIPHIPAKGKQRLWDFNPKERSYESLPVDRNAIIR